METLRAKEFISGLFHSGPTIAEKSELKGNTSGLDYLRVFLASSVIILHSFGVCYGLQISRPYYAGPFHILFACILPAFFGLSGFLLSSSLQRSKTLRGFLTLRVLRLFPALMVEVALSAFLLGSLLTELPIRAYFSSPKFWAYFLNTVGWVHFELPGVFTTVPQLNVVNRSLWTLPFELECYLAVSVISFVGLLKFKKTFAVLVGVAAFAGSA